MCRPLFRADCACWEIACNASIGRKKVTMPANLSIRNLDDELIFGLKRCAARHGRSTEAEVREILRQVLSQDAEADFDDLAAELRKLTAGRTHAPAETLLHRPKHCAAKVATKGAGRS
jgi:plasmid stability protein